MVVVVVVMGGGGPVGPAPPPPRSAAVPQDSGLLLLRPRLREPSTGEGTGGEMAFLPSEGRPPPAGCSPRPPLSGAARGLGLGQGCPFPPARRAQRFGPFCLPGSGGLRPPSPETPRDWGGPSETGADSCPPPFFFFFLPPSSLPYPSLLPKW